MGRIRLQTCAIACFFVAYPWSSARKQSGRRVHHVGPTASAIAKMCVQSGRRVHHVGPIETNMMCNTYGQAVDF